MRHQTYISFFRHKTQSCFFLIAFVFVLITAFSSGIGDNVWKKAREKDGVIVHTRAVDSARVKEVRTTAQFKTTLSIITSIIADVENRSRWFRSCESVTILKEYTPGHFIYQMRIDTPFLIADRELIQEMKIRQDPESGVVIIALKALPDYLPPNEDYIRVPIGDGHWVISSSSQNQVDIEFTYLNDPGKGIPASLANWYIAESPFRTMQYITKEIEKGAYRSGFDWIRD